jgi:hypothetical protein
MWVSFWGRWKRKHRCLPEKFIAEVQCLMVFITHERTMTSLLPSGVSKRVPGIVSAVLGFSRVIFTFLLCRLDTHSRLFRNGMLKWACSLPTKSRICTNMLMFTLACAGFVNNSPCSNFLALVKFWIGVYQFNVLSKIDHLLQSIKNNKLPHPIQISWRKFRHSWLLSL